MDSKLRRDLKPNWDENSSGLSPRACPMAPSLSHTTTSASPLSPKSLAMSSIADSFKNILSLPPIWAAQLGSVRSYPARDSQDPSIFPLDPQFFITPNHDLSFPLQHKIKPEFFHDGSNNTVKRFNPLDVDIGNPVPWKNFIQTVVKNVEEDLGFDRQRPGGRLRARMREVVVLKPGGRFPQLAEELYDMSDPYEIQLPVVAFMRIVLPCYFTGGSLEITGGAAPFRSKKKKPILHHPVTSNPAKGSSRNFHVEAWFKSTVTYNQPIIRGMMYSVIYTLHYHRANENISSLIPSPATLKTTAFLKNKLKAVFHEWTNRIEYPQDKPDEVVPRKIVVRLPKVAETKNVDLWRVFEQAAMNEGYWIARATFEYSEDKDVSLNFTEQEGPPYKKEQLALKTRDPPNRFVKSGLKGFKWAGRNTPMWAKRLNTILDMSNEWVVDYAHEVVNWMSEEDVVPKMDWRNVNFEEATGTVKYSYTINPVMVLIPISYNELTIKDASKGIPADGRIPRRSPSGISPIWNRVVPRTRIIIISESPEPEIPHEAIENGGRNGSAIANGNLNGDRVTPQEDEVEDGGSDQSASRKRNAGDKGKDRARESSVTTVVDVDFSNHNGSPQQSQAGSSRQAGVESSGQGGGQRKRTVSPGDRDAWNSRDTNGDGAENRAVKRTKPSDPRLGRVEGQS
ncbi:hypothetical protein DFH27DRAFT_623458 [Peziza echinospora]|nr:hypothetical protein DFH27DRAFT_623458 [Peziza echinospora]